MFTREKWGCLRECVPYCTAPACFFRWWWVLVLLLLLLPVTASNVAIRETPRLSRLAPRRRQRFLPAAVSEAKSVLTAILGFHLSSVSVQ